MNTIHLYINQLKRFESFWVRAFLFFCIGLSGIAVKTCLSNEWVYSRKWREKRICCQVEITLVPGQHWILMGFQNEYSPQAPEQYKLGSIQFW